MKNDELRTICNRLFKGKAVIVGIGNILRGDDGLGPHLVERLKDRIDIPCINAESSFDRYVGRIARSRPDSVLLIDAADLGEKPGAIDIMKPSDILDTTTSTHDVALKKTSQFLESRIDGTVYLLGVQPEKTGLNIGMSRKIRKAIRYLERLIVRAAKLRLIGSRER